MKKLLLQTYSIYLLILIGLFISLFTGSCNLLDTKGGSSNGNLTGSVLTNDTSEGIANALIRIIEADTIAAEMTTDENGEFAFQSLESGEKRIKLILPKGFQYLDETEKTVDIDGNINIEFLAEPIREITRTITPGSVDTLATSSGAFIEVDASASDQSVDVTIEEVNVFDNDFEFDSKPVRISIRQEGQPKRVNGEYGFSNSMSSNSAIINLKVWKFLTPGLKKVNYSYNVGSDEAPLYLFADTENTTYIDPSTSEEHVVPLHSFNVPSDVDFEAIMQSALLEDECDADSGLRTLEPILEYQQGEQPLIFVHGWQPFNTKCEDFVDFDPVNGTFGPLIEQLSMDSEVRSNYQFYKYIYPTNAPILAASDDLFNQIEDQGLINPVIIGHSMGGLVGRGLMATRGADKLTGLITLGTPHEGSPLADVSWIMNAFGTTTLCITYPQYCLLPLLNGGIFPQTNGLQDLAVNSEFIQNLVASENSKNNVFTMGGDIFGTSDYNFDSISPITLDPKFKLSIQLASRLMQSDAEKHDGIVPLSSAIPTWTSIQTSLAAHHLNIHSTSEVVTQIVPILSALSECGVSPPRVKTNDFNLSGSLARENGRNVRVTLNAISVDGTIATDLSKDNFTIIENDCVRNINDFSTENVGVDIVFVQDLSSSMGDAISGVRSSVITFANDLADLGINPQFASIGYSGSGNIPSTPATSPCEFLGPFKDLTDVNSFQSHVTNNWRATGGCDLPENGLEAIKYAHENVSWRTGAARVYIDITDVSHHTSDTNCNKAGPCTEQTLESIVAMLGETSTIHVVAPSNNSQRSASGGLDPWRLAEATGGEKLILPRNGSVDLTELGIANIVGEAISFTFESASPQQAIHTLRIRAKINDKIAELAPNLLRYKPINYELIQTN